MKLLTGSEMSPSQQGGMSAASGTCVNNSCSNVAVMDTLSSSGIPSGAHTAGSRISSPQLDSTNKLFVACDSSTSLSRMSARHNAADFRSKSSMDMLQPVSASHASDVSITPRSVKGDLYSGFDFSS